MIIYTCSFSYVTVNYMQGSCITVVKILKSQAQSDKHRPQTNAAPGINAALEKTIKTLRHLNEEVWYLLHETSDEYMYHSHDSPTTAPVRNRPGNHAICATCTLMCHVGSLTVSPQMPLAFLTTLDLCRQPSLHETN